MCVTCCVLVWQDGIYCDARVCVYSLGGCNRGSVFTLGTPFPSGFSPRQAVYIKDILWQQMLLQTFIQRLKTFTTTLMIKSTANKTILHRCKGLRCCSFAPFDKKNGTSLTLSCEWRMHFKITWQYPAPSCQDVWYLPVLTLQRWIWCTMVGMSGTRTWQFLGYRY
jgi:hypothetical protein